MADTPETNLITITIAQARATIDPAVPELASLLRHDGWEFVAGDQGVEERRSTGMLFYGLDPRSRLTVMPGLVPAVTARLQELGYAVRVVDRRVMSRRCRATTELAGLSDEEREFAERLADRPGGQIICVSMNHVTQRLALTCRLFPRAKICIQVGSAGKARQIWLALRDELGEGVQLARGAWSRRSRIVVGTYRELYGDWDIMLLPAPHELGGERARDIVVANIKTVQRIYAFCQNGHGDELAERVTDAIAGPVIHCDGQNPNHVSVHFCDLLPMNRCRMKNPLERKRSRYWHNPNRNDVIAGVAHALQSGDLSYIQERGLLPDLDTEQISQPVILLVESSEHGEELMRRLPGWTLRTVRRGELIERRHGKGGTVDTGMITTLMAAHLHPVTGNTWLWAGGGDHAPDISDWACCGNDGEPALLIDFNDDTDTRARRETYGRKRDYRERGWRVVGGMNDPAQALRKAGDPERTLHSSNTLNPKPITRSLGESPLKSCQSTKSESPLGTQDRGGRCDMV